VLIEDQLNAVRRSGPEWSRNSRLIPTSVDDDGNLTGYMDFSYTNPYDYLQRPIQGIFNAVIDGQDLGKDPGRIALNATMEAVSEIFEPFAGESIITEKIIDTTLRGGRQKQVPRFIVMWTRLEPRHTRALSISSMRSTQACLLSI
jgi:hypothetical protein